MDQNMEFKLALAFSEGSLNNHYLEELADDEDRHIRYYAAMNPHMPSSALEKLAEDEEGFIRKAVTENPNVPPDILEQLVYDESIVVRMEALKHLAMMALDRETNNIGANNIGANNKKNGGF